MACVSWPATWTGACPLSVLTGSRLPLAPGPAYQPPVGKVSRPVSLLPRTIATPALQNLPAVNAEPGPQQNAIQMAGGFHPAPEGAVVPQGDMDRTPHLFILQDVAR